MQQDREMVSLFVPGTACLPSSVWTQACYCLPCSYQGFGPWEPACLWLLQNFKNADKVENSEPWNVNV